MKGIVTRIVRIVSGIDPQQVDMFMHNVSSAVQMCMKVGMFMYTAHLPAYSALDTLEEHCFVLSC